MDRAKRERDERTTAKCPEAAVEDNKGRKRESCITVINNNVSCPATAPWPRAVDCKDDKRTMEGTSGGEEERTKEGQGDGWSKQPSA